MAPKRTEEYLQSLIQELRRLPSETEWVGFKENRAEPSEIGEYISALANSAALDGKAHAYLAWGIQDANHDIVGTNFEPKQVKVGNENLETGFSDC